MRSRFVVSVLCLSALVLPTRSLAAVVGTFDRTFSVTTPVQLEIRAHSGDVTVRGGSTGTVSVHAVIHANNRWSRAPDDKEVNELQQNPPIHQDGRTIRIDYVDTRDISVDYEITAPTATTVNSHTDSGDQRLSDLKGSFELNSGSGDFHLSRLTGETKVHAGSGSVSAKEQAGPVFVRLGSGDVELDRVGGGDDNIETASGSIEIKGAVGGVRVSSASGDITISGAPKAAWSVESSSGSVALRLPSAAAFDVDLHTSSGDVTVNHPVETVIQGRVREERKTVKGKVRGGGPLLSVRTSSGDVEVD